jgi:lysophospholipase L1-like esterase
MAEQSVKVMDFYPVTVADAVFLNGTNKNIKQYVDEIASTIPESGGTGETATATSKYKGLPWVILGDSFTVPSTNPRWYSTTREITDLTIAQNYALGGMRFCRKKFESSDEGTEDDYSIIPHLSDYDFTGAKVITISLGINDFFSSSPIIEPQGDYGSNFDVDTFTGAIEYTLNYIYTHLNGGDIPLIVLSTPTKSTTMADGVNRIGKRTEDYVENMRKICDKWGLPLCEWISCGVNKYTTMGGEDSGLASDTCHPNAKGAERLGTLMANTIMSY